MPPLPVFEQGKVIAKAVHNMGVKTAALCDAATAQGEAVFNSAGAKEVWFGPRIGMHILGGTIMGESVRNSVTNRYGQCHEIDNLFIAGGSLFPSCGAVNPTFTIYALGLQAAGYIVEQWSALAD